MALTNPKIFGLNVRTELADVRDKNRALRNLGLNPLDLEVIRGSSPSMDRYDWFSFSRLKNPIHKTLSRFLGESTLYVNVLTRRAGVDQTLFGNLDLNGSLSASSIRYRFLDGNNPGKLADISTSRVSAWSSSDSRANNQNLDTQKLARISYGARVSIISGGKLQFGSQSNATVPLGNATDSTTPQTGIDGPANQPRLQTSLVPELKEFPSEVPTSKIKCKIPNPTTGVMEDVYLYAMKGIPLVFSGVFRAINAKATINYTEGDSISASWKIVEKDNKNRYSDFREEGDVESEINTEFPSTKPRFIKFYYNPKFILSLRIRNCGIKVLPPTRLENCNELDFAYNTFTVFPNFSFIAPKLQRISLMRNRFDLTDVPFEDSLNNLILDKLKCHPTGQDSNVNVLNIEGTFFGSIERHIISSKLPNLTSLNFGRPSKGGSPATFNADNRPDSGLTNNKGSMAFCPDVPANTTNYSIQYNGFSSVDERAINTGGSVNIGIVNPDDGSISVANTDLPQGSYTFKTAPNLTNLNIYNNRNLIDVGITTGYALASKNELVNVNIGNCNFAIPDFQSASKLESFECKYSRGGRQSPLVSNTGSYKFDGCPVLKFLEFYATNLGNINFPAAFNHPNLERVDLRYTSIKGGSPNTADADQQNVISQNLFAQCEKLKEIFIDSRDLLVGKPIDSNAFLQNKELVTFWYRSYNATSGNLPDFSQNPKLRKLWIQQNSFDGTIPAFNTNQSLVELNLKLNNFDGVIPAFSGLPVLKQIDVSGNQLEGIGTPSNLPSLQKYYAYNNKLTGEIPNFSGCGNLKEISLYNNTLTNYRRGSFEQLYRIKFIDLSNNKLNQTAQDKILTDLYNNWTEYNRGNVTVNLRGNRNSTTNALESPSDEAKEIALILAANGWSITVNGGLT